MKWLGRLIKKIIRLLVVTSVFSAVIVVLDALLSPDGKDIHRN